MGQVKAWPRLLQHQDAGSAGLGTDVPEPGLMVIDLRMPGLGPTAAPKPCPQELASVPLASLSLPLGES